MSKARVATMWLEACSGCHMSFLDMDERIIALADAIELVYSPLVDAKEFPEDVDVALVSGGIGNREHARADQDRPRAHQGPGQHGRLRRHGQRALHAQFVQGG